jgi:hypothetical protein
MVIVPPVCSGLSYRYAVYGLTVLSDFPLTLPHDIDIAYGGDSLVVKLERVSQEYIPAIDPTLAHNESQWFQHVVLGDGAVYMRWENLFDFVISANGRRVQWRKQSEVAIESFEAYLTSFAISGALIQQGEEPLHATVVASDRGAVGLIGPSGAGKSTLAAFLMERGGSLVTDDMLRLEFRGDVALAFPGQGRLKLFKESAEKILKETADSGRFNPLTEKLIFQPSRVAKPNDPQPLSALYYLDTPPVHIDPNSISIERLSGVDLFKTIAASTFNSRLNAAERLERQFHFAERVARTVPVYKLMYPRDYNLLDQVSDLINQTARL